jgi:tetratricopeptide (TPR) repeat protein
VPAPGTIIVQYSHAGRDLVAVAGDYVVQGDSPGISSLHQLPPPPRDFTGRESEIRELLGAVEKRGFAISALQGMGGIGKTALALVLAERLSSQFPDAQIYLDLKGTSPEPLSAADAMGHVIRAFRPNTKPPEDESELRGLYQSILHGQRVILVMDNANDAAQVEPLIPAANSTVLVTSRRHFTLPGLFAKNMEVLPPADARHLLIAIACGPDAVAAVSAPLPPTAELPQSARARDVAAHADEMAKLCGYLPLALRAAASTLAETPDLSPTHYIQLLADTRKRLELCVPGKDQTVEASLALSYDVLSSDLQRQFRSLAVFPDTFIVPSAAAVWNTELDPAQDSLSILLKYSLLEYDSLKARYKLHDLVRLFAHARVTAEERDGYYRGHAEHFVSVAALASQLFLRGGEGILRGLGLIDREWSNIQAGQSWAAARAAEDDGAARLTNMYPNAGACCLDLRQHPRERMVWLEAALAAAQRLNDRTDEGMHLANLGSTCSDLGQNRRAIKLLESALTIEREIGNRSGEGTVLNNLGLAYAHLSENRRAIEFYESSLTIAREIGDVKGEASALSGLGHAYIALGEAHRAIECHEKALAIDREIGDRRGEGRDLGSLGLGYAALGETSRAIESYQQELAIDREIGDRRGEGSALGNMGMEYNKLGDNRRAIELYEQHLAIAREIGHLQAEGNALGNLGNAYAELGEPRRAIDFYGQNLVILREIGDRRGEGYTFWNISVELYKLGDRAQAVAHAEIALAILGPIEDPQAAKVRAQLTKWRGTLPQSGS